MNTSFATCCRGQPPIASTPESARCTRTVLAMRVLSIRAACPLCPPPTATWSAEQALPHGAGVIVPQGHRRENLDCVHLVLGVPRSACVVRAEPFEKCEDNRLQALPLSSLIQVRPTAGQSVQFAVLLSVLSVVVALLAVASSALRACKDSAGVDGRNHANLTCCTPAFSCCRRRRMLDDPPNVVKFRGYHYQSASPRSFVASLIAAGTRIWCDNWCSVIWRRSHCHCRR